MQDKSLKKSKSIKFFQHCSSVEICVKLEEGAQVTISSQIKYQQKLSRLILFHTFKLK